MSFIEDQDSLCNVPITWRVSNKKQELLIFRDHMGSPPVLGRVRVAHLISFLYYIVDLFVFILCLVCPMVPVSWIVHYLSEHLAINGKSLACII